jgi:hypothetical protein
VSLLSLRENPLSEYVKRAWGAPSGLTNVEREVLADAAVAVVMEELGVDEREARDVLGSAADDGLVHTVGDQQVVGMTLGDRVLFACTRARLRQVAHPSGQTNN